ncbi:MAG: hypothetical protein J5835_03015 [Bacteroidales bacterium]|nr:hypothetical protein [Bacteroidales bacterium]
MKKLSYIPPETWDIHMNLEAPLCLSGSGEDMDPWSAPAFPDFTSFNIF